MDTNNSSAWLWVARGEKEWRCVHGDDCALLYAAGNADGRGREHGAGLPDLFALSDGNPRERAAELARFPGLARARLFRGVQRAGDICFNPACCIHAVHNTTLTVSLTHNFVDASNLMVRAYGCLCLCMCLCLCLWLITACKQKQTNKHSNTQTHEHTNRT